MQNTRAILTQKQRYALHDLLSRATACDRLYEQFGVAKDRRERSRALGKLSRWIRELHMKSMSKG